MMLFMQFFGKNGLPDKNATSSGDQYHHQLLGPRVFTKVSTGINLQYGIFFVKWGEFCPYDN